jgi:hypothetical protein
VIATGLWETDSWVVFLPVFAGPTEQQISIFWRIDLRVSGKTICSKEKESVVSAELVDERESYERLI